MRSSLLSFISGQQISQESIDFQKGSMFFRDLTNAFKELCKEKGKTIYDSPVAGLIEKIIKHHTNMTVVFALGENGPSIRVPEFNKNNVLANELYKYYATSAAGIDLINSTGKAIRGGVNLKTSKVSGIFSEIKVILHYPVSELLNPKFIPEEHASFVLHEVGHMFTYFEFMNHVVTTNQVLAGMSRALDESNTIEERESVFITIKKSQKLSNLDVKTLAKSTDNKVAEIVVLTNIFKQLESELGTNIYDETSWEYLSDQFCARHGAGRYLITGLDKSFKDMSLIAYRSTPVYLFMEVIKLALLIVPLSKAMMVVRFLALSIIISDGIGSRTDNYDTPEARIKRVRNQIVEHLKDKKLSGDDRERLLADIAAIDEILKHIDDRRQFLGVLWDTIVPWAHKRYNQEMLQKDLEAIAVNDLFVKSAEIKQLSKSA
jgi:hypothetical protein